MHVIKENDARNLGIRLFVVIFVAESVIMLSSQLFVVDRWLPPILIALADAALLSILASMMVSYWASNLMKIPYERKKAQQDLELFRNLMDQSGDVLAVIDSKTGRFLDMNRSASARFGYTPKELLNMNVMDIETDIPDADAWKRNMQRLKTKGQAVFETSARRKDGTSFPAEINVRFVAGGERELLVSVVRDITDRKRMEESLHFLAYYDSLTGLPNRNFFKELLGRTSEHARRYNRLFALLLIDIDDFKRINDTLGHESGDRLLSAVSPRLLKSIRSSDYAVHMSEEKVEEIARLGGDEFVVMLQELADVQDAGQVARRILSELSQSYDLDGTEVFVTASIGISIFPADGAGDDLLKNADAALNHAKSKGKNNYQFYSKALNAAALEFLKMEHDLHRALERDELLVYYQPKMALPTREIVSMEALVRWRHPELGFIPPATFIPIAEKSGLIMPIGRFVLRTACLRNKSWQEQGLKKISVAVNLSSRQFDQKNIKTQVLETLRSSGLSPEYLEIEVTESMIMQNPEEAVTILRELKDAGISISVDDFGTGYSSLSYLNRLPLDYLKIDISFVRHVVTNPNDATIVKTIIAMAHSLNLKVIAEGVETEEQLTLLEDQGCDLIQGFLLSPPVPADEFPPFLKGNDQP